MCGITAVIKLNSGTTQGDLDWSEQALREMRLRGPDSLKFENVDRSVILGAVRLRITDNSCDRADMPLQDSSRERYSIVMNGEIYNYQVLKRLLEDYPFQTESDTEVVLAAYQKWGLDFIKYLEGAFALIIFDKVSRVVVIASDSVGEKPLYLRENGNTIWLSSTISSLMGETSFSKQIDPVSVSEFLIRGFVTAPYTYQKNIQKIPPSTLMVISLETGQVSRKRYSLPIKQIEGGLVNLPLKDALYLAAEQVIPKDQDASVFLSSGIDSRTVLGLAKFMGRKINAISLGVESGDLSCGNCESALAEDAAINSGFDYHRVLLKPGDYLNHWDSFIDSLSEPVAAFEGPFLIALAKKAAELGKIVLSGALSDELFDGYGNFARINANRGNSDFIARYLKATCAGYGEVSSLFNDAHLLESVKSRIFEASGEGKQILRYSKNDTEGLAFEDENSEGEVVRALDILGVGSAYELFLLDQVCMSVSLESRAIFAHPRVINAAISIPLPRSSGGPQFSNKYCLRNAVSGLISNCNMPKRAFPIPKSFVNALKEAGELKTVLRKRSTIQDVLNLDVSSINHLLARNDYDAQEFALRLSIIERFL
jgi:asparagine synthase (glutamine-hydrolysing)